MQYSIRQFHPCVYIMASKKYGTTYIGVTSDLVKRIYEHKHRMHRGSFTDMYHIELLVYYEMYDTMDEAITREKNMKKWNREWKTRLIEQRNPEWRDLYDEIV